MQLHKWKRECFIQVAQLPSCPTGLLCLWYSILVTFLLLSYHPLCLGMQLLQRAE